MKSHRRGFFRQAGLAVAGMAVGSTRVSLGQTGGKRRGIAMTIGLNNVDTRKYPGAPPLRGCINDTKSIRDLARIQKFECLPSLIDSQATAAAVIKGIRDTARELKSGDIFLLQYSGHGGQVRDRNRDESDGKDETWCLYDRQLLDDELGRLWTEFAEGVRIFLISDSCHSGSVARGRGYLEALKLGGANNEGRGDADDVLKNLGDDKPVFRYMPDEVLLKNYQSNKSEYDQISDELGESREGDDESIKASVLLISGCQDNQLSGDLPKNGLFTSRLLSIWNDGNFKGDYREFHSRIILKMPATQSPNLYPIGQPDLRFWRQKPFTI